MIKEKTEELVKAAVLGTVVGDALGVPVEFAGREARVTDPVKDMREYGTHNQPRGTWSDDSSMLLAALESMIERGGVDYGDMMEKFCAWKYEGAYTPYGSVFDIGITCSRALAAYKAGREPLMCGGSGEMDNGNGSLMRIMPMSLYYALRPEYWEADTFSEAANVVGNASALTHGHPRSKMACVIYTSICHELIYGREEPIGEALGRAIRKALAGCDYRQDNSYGRLADTESFGQLSARAIKSGGYVVDTLEAAVWCIMNSGSYEECVLKAVNLGDDTDTVGAVTGGLAGLLYGYEGIPMSWIDALARKDWICGKCSEYAQICAH